MSDVAWMLDDGVSHDANVPRWATAALAGDVGGVCGAGHLAVSQDDTPAMRVKVAAGYVLVKGGSSSDQGVYAWYYAGGTVDIAPGDPTNPRDTIVGVQVDDDFWDASGENRCRVVAVDGTPAGSPADPSLPASFTRLARVRVDANESTSIVNGKITDLRTYAGDYGSRRTYGPKQYRATGSAGTTSGTTPLTICTLSIPAQAVAGKVIVQSFTRVDKSSSSDAFNALLIGPGPVTLANGWPTAAAANATVVLNGSFDLAANTSATVTVALERTAGSGTASTFNTRHYNHIDGLWVAD